MSTRKSCPFLNWKTPIYILITLAFTSCISARKVDRWVAKKYKDAPAPRIRKGNENISVKTTMPSMGSAVSVSDFKTKRFLPLILYWQFENRTTCRLNPQIAVNNVINTLQNYHINALQQKLNGRRLELTIEKLPNTFVVSDIEHGIFIVYMIYWYKMGVEPEKEGMLVSYKLINSDGSVDKSGQVSASNMDKGIPVGPFQSVRNKTWDYLDQYNANISTMSKEVIDAIADEL